MMDIIDRLRGELSPQEFLLLLLKIADSPGSVLPTPDIASQENKSLRDRRPS
jgi:hypothetical protein